MKKCIGFGEFENKCNKILTVEDNPHWCKRCDKLRCNHITKQLESLAGITEA